MQGPWGCPKPGDAMISVGPGSPSPTRHLLTCPPAVWRTDQRLRWEGWSQANSLVPSLLPGWGGPYVFWLRHGRRMCSDKTKGQRAGRKPQRTFLSGSEPLPGLSVPQYSCLNHTHRPATASPSLTFPTCVLTHGGLAGLLGVGMSERKACRLQTEFPLTQGVSHKPCPYLSLPPA